MFVSLRGLHEISKCLCATFVRALQEAEPLLEPMKGTTEQTPRASLVRTMGQKHIHNGWRAKSARLIGVILPLTPSSNPPPPLPFN